MADSINKSNLPDHGIPLPAKCPHAPASRRGFLLGSISIAIGAILGIIPFAAGLATYFDPLRRKSGNGGLIRVAPLDAIPDDGLPHVFAIVADRTDAWTFFPKQAIGAVYLRRNEGQEDCDALNATCPHAGCFVDFSNEQGTFLCPCHKSAFQIDGESIKPSPSPRNMDSLECETQLEGKVQVVYVKFENFYTGFSERIRKP